MSESHSRTKAAASTCGGLLAVAATGLLSWEMGARWPAPVVGLLLAGIFLQSAHRPVRPAPRTARRS